MKGKLYIISALFVVHSIFSILGIAAAQRAALLLIEIMAFSSLVVNARKLFNDRTVLISLIYVVYLLFGAFTADEHLHNLIYTLTEVLWWPSVFILFTSLFKYNSDYYGWIKSFVYVMFFINTSLFLLEISTRFSSNDALRTNTIFFILMLTPMVTLIRNTRNRFALLFAILTCSVISGKRSAMIAIALVLMIEWIRYMKNSTRHKFRTVVTTVFAVIFLAGAVYAVESALGISFIERFQGIEEDGGSGRTEAFIQVSFRYSQLPLEDKLWGCGHNAVRIEDFVSLDFSKDEALSAHNDFLEVLYDYGLIGLILYLIFIFQIIALARYWKKVDREYYLSMLGSLAVFFVMSMVSHLVIYPTYSAYLMIFWTYMYNEKRKRILVLRNK